MDFRELNIRTLSDIDKLPWFEKNAVGDLIVKASADIPPVIDTHTHVGWSYGFAPAIDMTKVTKQVDYFYNFETDQDLLYDDTIHPTAEEGAQMSRGILLALFKRSPASMTHTAANFMAEMDRSNYRHTCLLPIEASPVGSRHAERTLGAAAMDTRFIPLAAVHPWPWGPRKMARLEAQFTAGARAVKYHPEFQFMAPDNKHAMALFEWCQARDVPVLAHCGYKGPEPAWMREKSEPDRFRPMLQAFPKLRVIMAHTGIILHKEVLTLAREFSDQIWLDIAGQDVPTILEILHGYDHRKILYGSDWPFYPLAVALARALVATEGREPLRADLLHDNAARFLGLETL
ncbi:MAG: amidohydrolase family protein [Desulfobacterales bacterium]